LEEFEFLKKIDNDLRVLLKVDWVSLV
jgi:hypothetical protein